MARKRQEDPNDPFIKMGGHYVDEDEETPAAPQQTATPQEDPFIAMGGRYLTPEEQMPWANIRPQEALRSLLDLSTMRLGKLPSDLRRSYSSMYLPDIAGTAPAQFMLSAGRAAQEPVYQLGDIINRLLSRIPGVQLGPIPRPPAGAGWAGAAGEQAGALLPFVGGGEALVAGLRGAEALPAVGRAAQALSAQTPEAAIARRMLGMTGYGALMTPEARLRGAQTGLGLSALLDLPPGAAAGMGQGIGRAFGPFRPQQHADQLLFELGKGQTLEGSARSLADDIRQAYAGRVAEGNEMYRPVFENHGATEITPEKYGKLKQAVFDQYPPKVEDFHNAYNENPHLLNAHFLQSQLGSTIRGLKTPDIATKIAKDNLIKARSALMSDIRNQLNEIHPEVSKAYTEATNNWRENVVPYIEHPQISKIATGKVTNPRNVTTIFKNPEEDVKKIVSDLGEDAKNKILYAELGKIQPGTPPEKLQKAAEKLDQKGLESYITPSLDRQLDILASKIRRRNIAQLGLGAATGAAVAHPLSGLVTPGVAELGGAIAGGLGATPLARALNGRAELLRETVMPDAKLRTAQLPIEPTWHRQLYQALQPAFRTQVPYLQQLLQNVIGGGS